MIFPLAITNTRISHRTAISWDRCIFAVRTTQYKYY